MRPSDRPKRALQHAAGATPPLIITRASERSLEKPPTMRRVLKTAEKFAPRYDEWMRESHHPIAHEMLRDYYADRHIEGPIAEVGCGTGVLSANLMLSVCTDMLRTGRAAPPAGDAAPAKFLLLDASRVMIDLARDNVRAVLGSFLSASTFISPGLEKSDFTIVDSPDWASMSLMLRNSEILKVWFACAEAEQIGKVSSDLGLEIRTAVLSYVMHWMRGSDGKLHAAESMFDALPQGGRLVSLEEWPLVVRCDLHPDDADVQELAKLIRGAVTVLPIPEIEMIFGAAGFIMHAANAARKRIDDYHDMYGRVYEKP